LHRKTYEVGMFSRDRGRHDTPGLLTMPTYGGTLAAVRCLGEHGIRLTVAGQHLLAPARWSRYATRWTRCPSEAEPERLLAWLLDFGRREPGHFLYPTSDDLAFLFAAHAAELGEHFCLYQPSLSSIVRALDKKLLYEACEAVGLETVPTTYPATDEDALRCVQQWNFPVILKTRTQVRRILQDKGSVVVTRKDLPAALRAHAERNHYRSGLEDTFGDVTKPMIQQYFPRGAEAIYSIAGFIDRTGELFAARGAVKVLPRTRPVGFGLAFEAAPLDPGLAEKVLRLCRLIGHFGVFEVEFVRDGERRMVIDFNPRFYHQMAFDVARGLPLPLLAWHAARGDETALADGIAASARVPDDASIYCHRVSFELSLATQRLCGSLTAAERDRWKQWYERHRTRAVDASASSRDWLPGLVHAAAEALAEAKVVGRVVRTHLPSSGARSTGALHPGNAHEPQ
jgi:predicted ATP-grasp superfamily ATP-dependent carboligase